MGNSLSLRELDDSLQTTDNVIIENFLMTKLILLRRSICVHQMLTLAIRMLGHYHVIKNVDTLIDPFDDQIDSSCKIDWNLPTVDICSLNDSTLSCDDKSEESCMFERNIACLKFTF